MSMRFVAAIVMIPGFPSKPSNSTSIWFIVCSLSSFPPANPAPRCLPTASISSMKIMHGAYLFACVNISRTRDAPTPTNISTNSDPEIDIKGTPASPATAFAKRVFPVPGGPSKITPLGIRQPFLSYASGCLRKSTTSSNSIFAPPHPSTSSKEMPVLGTICTLALLFPKEKGLRLPPTLLDLRDRKNSAVKMAIGLSNIEKIFCAKPPKLELDFGKIITSTP
mmetsp:Transcript_11168/g.15726  ORF Transcript_11168/g.15726 Transcript_11168/m.15726 type:complete len:223 (-) Transcript_11168:583-1251(-)